MLNRNANANTMSEQESMCEYIKLFLHRFFPATVLTSAMWLTDNLRLFPAVTCLYTVRFTEAPPDCLNPIGCWKTGPLRRGGALEAGCGQGSEWITESLWVLVSMLITGQWCGPVLWSGSPSGDGHNSYSVKVLERKKLLVHLLSPPTYSADESLYLVYYYACELFDSGEALTLCCSFVCVRVLMHAYTRSEAQVWARWIDKVCVWW